MNSSILTAPKLEDVHNRTFPYLRLSLTDACNFKCSYCLPNGFKNTCKEKILSKEEILRVVRAFSELGVWKIRLTGGEPTLRSEFIEIAEEISKLPGIQKCALTTNGFKLERQVQNYFNAGIKHLNISVDSLNKEKFKNITGYDFLDSILRGIDSALTLKFSSVKINAVLMKNINDNELDDFINYVSNKDISIRFIELMRTLDNVEYFEKHHVSAAVIAQKLLEKGFSAVTKQFGDGPSQVFKHPNLLGTIGIIAPYSKDFCKGCNRLRVSSRGDLHLCLFGNHGYSLRHLLQSDSQKEELKEKIKHTLGFKEASHRLEQNDSGAMPHLSVIGG